MNIWVLSMWVISSLMACWSFSLLVRSISEAVGRLRKRLISHRSTKSFWLGLVLMLVCAAAAGFAGYMAVYLEGLFTRPSERWTTPVSIIGGSVGVFGIFMIIMAFVGDRARGRVRCPKCWYDMNDASGLQCPECGLVAKDAEQFSTARRPKWAFILGFLLFITGAYPVVLNKKIAKHGPLVMIPTWVLMAGWEDLPESWILRNWGKGQPGCLEERIGLKWISQSKLERFGEELVEPMMGSKAARWDHRHVNLLASVYRNGGTWLDYRDDYFPSAPQGVDLDKLLQLSAIDMLGAMTTNTPNTLDTHILESFDDTSLNTYNMAWSWVIRNGDRSFEGDQFPGRLFYIDYMRSPEIHAETARALKDVLSEFNNERFIKLISDDEKDVRDDAFRLAIDTGLVDLNPEIFFESGDQLNLRKSKLQFHLGRVFHLLAPESQDRAFEVMSHWIRSGDPAKRAYAVSSVQYLQNNVGYNQSTPVDSYHRVVQDIIEYAVHDVRTPYTDKPKMSIGWIASGVITRYNTSGEIAFPILLDRIANGKGLSGAIRWGTGDPDAYESLVKYWLDTFAGFANSDKTSTRRWILRNIPTQTGTPYDAQLDAMVVEYLFDTDKQIRESALRKMKSRGALDLVPEDYDAITPSVRP